MVTFLGGGGGREGSPDATWSSPSASSLSAAAEFFLCNDTESHLAAVGTLAEGWRHADSVEGLADGVSVVEAAARKTLEIEAGARLQTWNIVRTETTSWEVGLQDGEWKKHHTETGCCCRRLLVSRVRVFGRVSPG